MIFFFHQSSRYLTDMFYATIAHKQDTPVQTKVNTAQTESHAL